MSEFEKLKLSLLEKMEIEHVGNREQKVNQTILVASGVSAGVAIQPLPFADFPVLVFIESIMVLKIGEFYGYSISMDRARDILKEIAGVVGMGWIAKNAILAGYKSFIPFAGGFFTIPLVYGSCYAIGQVASYYFQSKVDKKPFDEAFAKKLFKFSIREGEELRRKEGVRK